MFLYLHSGVLLVLRLIKYIPTPIKNKEPEYFFLKILTSGLNRPPSLRKLTVSEFRDLQTHAIEGQKWSRLPAEDRRSNCGADGVQEHGR